LKFFVYVGSAVYVGSVFKIFSTSDHRLRRISVYDGSVSKKFRLRRITFYVGSAYGTVTAPPQPVAASGCGLRLPCRTRPVCLPCQARLDRTTLKILSHSDHRLHRSSYWNGRCVAATSGRIGVRSSVSGSQATSLHTLSSASRSDDFENLSTSDQFLERR